MALFQTTGTIALAILLGACAATKQAKDVQPSGFLGDLDPKLHRGQEGEALLVYKHPTRSPEKAAQYKKILLDPVTVWRDRDERLNGVPREAMQRLADHFFNRLYLTLSEDYEMVTQPGPHTMRVQVALTHVDASYPVMDVVSTAVPQLRLISKGKELATGKPAFVGEARIEAKPTDSETGEVLAAVVDRRVGGKTLTAESFNSWGDVHDSMDFWATLAKFRLCQERGGTNCVNPKE